MRWPDLVALTADDLAGERGVELYGPQVLPAASGLRSGSSCVLALMSARAHLTCSTAAEPSVFDG